MLRFTSLLAVLLVLAFAIPLLAADEKKTDKIDPNKLPKDKKEAAEKIATGSSVTGKITAWTAADKTMTLQVTIQTAVPNAGQIQNLANLRQQYAQYLNQGNRQAAAQKQMEMARVKTYDLKEEHLKVELIATDDMKVRTMVLPPVFDDKGKQRRYTEQEKRKLKGQGAEAKLEGYQAEMDDLKTDAQVKVYLKPVKKEPRSSAKKDKKEKDEDAPINRREATVIVILYEPMEKK